MAVVAANDAARAVALLRAYPVSAAAGRRAGSGGGLRVSPLGVERVLEMPAGEVLPRIC